MARYRLVHVGAAALLAAAAATTVSLAQSVFAGDGSGSSFVSMVPCRLADTRADSTVGPRSTPVGSGEAVTIVVAGTNGNCTIPSTATAISTNVTIANPTASSYLTIYPADVELGQSSNLNWQAPSAPVANHATVGLSVDGAINVYNNAGSVDVIIDVSGYYVPGITAQGAQGPKGDKGDTGDAVLAGLNCTDGQSITWNGTSSTWQCTTPAVDTDSLAALSCTTSQTIRWSGTAWECRSDPITATLFRVANNYGYMSTCCEVRDFFSTYSPNVDPYGTCYSGFCAIRLEDVTDHTSCQVTATSGPYSYEAYVTTSPSYIDISWNYPIGPDDQAFVSVSCTV